MTTQRFDDVSISVRQGRDAGCEVTDAEWDRLEAAQVAALEDAYPGADVTVESYDGSGPTSIVIGDPAGGTVGEQDVDDVLQGVWEAGEFWRPDGESLLRLNGEVP